MNKICTQSFGCFVLFCFVLICFFFRISVMNLCISLCMNIIMSCVCVFKLLSVLFKDLQRMKVVTYTGLVYKLL